MNNNFDSLPDDHLFTIKKEPSSRFILENSVFDHCISANQIAVYAYIGRQANTNKALDFDAFGKEMNISEIEINEILHLLISLNVIKRN